MFILTNSYIWASFSLTDLRSPYARIRQRQVYLAPTSRILWNFDLRDGLIRTTRMISKLRNRSPWEHEDVWEESKWRSFAGSDSRNISKIDVRSSLAWIELSMVLAKLIFNYDLQLLDQGLDWHRDSRMATLWQKPAMRVRVSARTKKTV